MKKLLIFMLVFGLVSAAHAISINFELDSGTIGAGNTITIKVVADTTCDGILIGAVAEATSVNSDNQGTAVADKDGAVVDQGSDVVLYSAYAGSTINQDGYVDNYQGVLWDIGQVTGPTGGIPANNTIVKFQYTIDSLWGGSAYWVAPLAQGTTYYYAAGQSASAGASQGTFSGPTYVKIGGLQIPEPATIAMLGLGGLLLLRRRR
jgi:hypothetical protein